MLYPEGVEGTLTPVLARGVSMRRRAYLPVVVVDVPKEIAYFNPHYTIADDAVTWKPGVTPGILMRRGG